MVGAKDAATAKTLYARAHKLFEARCPLKGRLSTTDRGVGEICYLRGELLRQGVGEPADIPGALVAYRLSCDHFYGDGCHSLVAYENKRDGHLPADAVDVLNQGCSLEVGRACAWLSEIVSGSDPSSATAGELASRGCDLDAFTCGTVADLYRDGHGKLAKDDKAATDAYRQACEASNQDACTLYALRLHDGTGVTADVAKARDMMEAACKAQHVASCDQLAHWLLASDPAVPADDARAYKIMQEDCAKNSTDACYMQGWMTTYNRRGAAKLEPADAAKEAIAYYEQGCTNGGRLSCFTAGTYYRDGIGVAKDLATAYARFNTACYPQGQDGNLDACEALASLAVDAHPTRDEVLRARARDACSTTAATATARSTSTTTPTRSPRWWPCSTRRARPPPASTSAIAPRWCGASATARTSTRR